MTSSAQVFGTGGGVGSAEAAGAGEISARGKGVLIAFEAGKSITYGLFNAQERGTLFIGAGVDVYAGMIIGENPRPEDMEVNVCKEKHLKNSSCFFTLS